MITNARRLNQVCLFLILGAIFSMLVYVATVVFQSYPFSMDEYGYLYQANLFAKGRLYEGTTPSSKALEELYIIVTADKRFSKYPFGTALAMTPGVWLGHPAWTNPLLATITLGLFYFLTMALFHCRFSAMALVALLGANTYFQGYAASLFSQTLALLLTTAAYATLYQFSKTRANQYLLATGLLLGYLVTVRPLDAFCVIIPISFVLIFHLKIKVSKPITLNWILPISVFTVLLCSYFYFLVGRFSLIAHDITETEFRLNPTSQQYSSVLQAYAAQYLDSLKTVMLPLLKDEFVPLIGAPLFSLAGVGLFRKIGFWKGLILLHAFLMIALYNLQPGGSWSQYGARYQYPILVDIAILAAGGLELVYRTILNRFGGFRGVSIGTMSLVLIGIVTWELQEHEKRLSNYKARFDLVLKEKERMKAQCPDGSVVVLTNTGEYTASYPAFVNWWDFKRNGLRDDHRMIVSSQQQYDQLDQEDKKRFRCTFNM